jgi:hypothetical protein
MKPPCDAVRGTIVPCRRAKHAIRLKRLYEAEPLRLNQSQIADLVGESVRSVNEKPRSIVDSRDPAEGAILRNGPHVAEGDHEKFCGRRDRDLESAFEAEVHSIESKRLRRRNAEP